MTKSKSTTRRAKKISTQSPSPLPSPAFLGGHSKRRKATIKQSPSPLPSPLTRGGRRRKRTYKRKSRKVGNKYLK